jgi:hypothetical protein
MDVALFLVLLWAPSVLIIFSFVGLAQFKLLYGALSSIGKLKRTNVLLDWLQPRLHLGLKALESTFGPSYKLTFTITHVLLVGHAD